MKQLKIEFPHDLIGMASSGLCLTHCLATPFLFAVHAEIRIHQEPHLQWWNLLDSIFLVISFFAVWRSGRTTSKPWLRWSLWISWSLLVLVILNEKLSLFLLVEEAIYIPSISLILFHLYNRKYCKCQKETCCAR